MQITPDELTRLCPQASPSIIEGIIQHQALLKHADITTPLRLCHFMAQIAVESDHLKTTREYASGAQYEGRIDLGNTQPGDGQRYRGRGLIQTTGRYNYGEARDEIRKLGIECPDFEASPGEMEDFPWALLGGIIYWKVHNINQHADRDDILIVTRRVNGGTNGLTLRKQYLAKAKGIWLIEAPVLTETDKAVIAFEKAAKRMQRALACEGLYSGNIDGHFGPASWKALTEYRERVK